ncbi:hypothetical protein YTPLAS18_10610 [Nitrospira sp.]|nr:hypothetical protein YTPLAS18_10610 [Nitrospira sp.]
MTSAPSECRETDTSAAAACVKTLSDTKTFGGVRFGAYRSGTDRSNKAD